MAAAVEQTLAAAVPAVPGEAEEPEQATETAARLETPARPGALAATATTRMVQVALAARQAPAAAQQESTFVGCLMSPLPTTAPCKEAQPDAVHNP